MNHDLTHKKRLLLYIKQVEKAFEKLISEATTLAVRVKLTEELFKFKKNPKISKEFELILTQYRENLENIIIQGTTQEWALANEKINHLQTLQLQRVAGKISQAVLVQELEKVERSPHNAQALKTFQERKIKGFTVSDRVWKVSEQMRDELEFAIDVSLTEGKSANELAREIKKLLNEPDRLYRRVRDKHGNLVLSQNAKNFHPGQGVYRSSHKNALRLAKEEINTAYRESEQMRIMQNNDIVGVEIHLSPSHKIYDICDELKGKYPKDFKWSKWHIGCMCHRRTIMKSDEEFIKELQNGENLPPNTSENYVADVPNNFKKWHKDNADKFANWKTKPNFLEENKKYWGEKEDKKGEDIKRKISLLMKKSKESENEVFNLANHIAEKYNGKVAPINLKTEKSIFRKVINELNGNVDDIKDAVRTTIVFDYQNFQKILQNQNIFSIFERVKIQTPDKFSGYSGVITNFKTKNGIFAEIQFNTDKMIYAKEEPNDAIRIIGQKRWNEIRKEVGIEGGLGHQFYEEMRLLPKKDPKRLEIEKKSIEYYSKFR